MTRWFLLMVLCPGAMALAACGDDDEARDGGTDPSVWLVGTEGTMLRLSAGDVSGYPLDLQSDLFDIDCRGLTDAFAVGEGGVALRTLDGGETWTRLSTGTSATLRAVAAAHQDVLYVVGDGGEMRLSRDSGASFVRVATGGQSFTDVSTTDDGAVALAVAADGSVHRYELGRSLEMVRPAEGPPLRSVSITPSGAAASAVGDDGLTLRSDDGGRAWSPVPSQTSRDLHAVRLSSDGRIVVAAGEAGVVVRWTGEGIGTQELLTEGRSLRGLHLSAGGTGVVVGDRGAIFETWDIGRAWSAVSSGTDRDLHAVDDLHVGPHF